MALYLLWHRTLFLVSKRFRDIKISLSDSDNDFPEFQALGQQRFNFNYPQLLFSRVLKDRGVGRKGGGAGRGSEKE